MKLLTTIFILFAFLQGQGINVLADDEYDKYTSVGNLGLTITNFGILGNGWNLMEDGSINPSCQYKQQTEISREQIEHFSYAGLWVGGIVDGERRVSSSIVDGVFEAGNEGFELFPKSPITIQSSIASTTQDSMAKYFSPYATSHQDMIINFKDYGDLPTDNLGIPNHNPLGIDIRLESYAWNYSYADAFVILNYTFKNLFNAYKNIEILWASTREAYNFIQAQQLGCNIITMPPKIINQIACFGKSSNQLTIETVNGFLSDSKKSKFKL